MTRATKVIEEIKTELSDLPKTSSPGKVFFAMFDIFPLEKIADEKHNKLALRVMEKLMLYMNAHEGMLDANTDEQIRGYMATLSDLIHEFESERYKFGRAPAHEMLTHLMEMHDLMQTDLAEELGGQSVVSLILRGERELNVRQIKSLAKRFKVSPEVFL